MIARYHGETESDDENVKLLESITKDIFDAVNARNFEAPVWGSVAPWLISRVRWFTKLYGFQGTDKKAFVDVLKQFTTDYPQHEWYARTLTTHVHDKKHYAETFVMSENDGFPPGLIRQGMCRFEYRKIDDRWLLVEYEILSGVLPGLE